MLLVDSRGARDHAKAVKVDMYRNPSLSRYVGSLARPCMVSLATIVFRESRRSRLFAVLRRQQAEKLA